MPPQECFSGNFWELHKTVYGLCDAARSWYLRVLSELISLSDEVCSLDESIFFGYNGDCLEKMVCLYLTFFIFWN